MLIGCNYWASHAGTEMWTDWNEAQVRDDFKLLADSGCQLIRVFPNWRDFQPLELYSGFRGHKRELRYKGQRLADSSGVDPEMLQRFRRLCEIATDNNLQILASLVTGWMSGSLFIPPAFAGLNPMTDLFSLRWQVRFVRKFVREMKDCTAIRYWELGNECNCMGAVTDSSTAWNWTNAIASAIRLEDPERPVTSGMHGLMPGGADVPESTDIVWSIETQGELCDLMTAHPYPHSPSKLAARVDPHTSIRIGLQATVEMLYYSDIGQVPGSVEEIGTFCSSYCAEKEKADFLRNTLYNSWAHGAEFFLWWCGFDQSKLNFPPYEWSAWERELGLFDADLQEKPVARVMREFNVFLQQQPSIKLPPFRRDALCILTREQSFDQIMSNSWSSFILAKQCGFDIKFQNGASTVDDYPLYIVPGLRGAGGLYSYEYQTLLEKVKCGATLYISLDDGALAPFESVFGAEVATREMRRSPAQVQFADQCFPINSPYRLDLRMLSGEVLAREIDGNPVLIRAQYGRGQVYLLTLPLELDISGIPGAFHRQDALLWHKFYQCFADVVISQRVLRSRHPLLTLTEHADLSAPDELLCVAVNNSSQDLPVLFDLAAGWEIISQLSQEIPAHSGEVIKLKKVL